MKHDLHHQAISAQTTQEIEDKLKAIEEALEQESVTLTAEERRASSKWGIKLLILLKKLTNLLYKILLFALNTSIWRILMPIFPMRITCSNCKARLSRFLKCFPIRQWRLAVMLLIHPSFFTIPLRSRHSKMYLGLRLSMRN